MFDPTPSRIPAPYHRRNFLMHMTDGILFMGGLAFTSTEIVLSVLIYRLGGSEAAIGGVFALAELGVALPQLLTAPFIDGLPRKKPLVLFTGLAQRTPWLILAYLLFFTPFQQDGSDVPLVLGLIASTFLITGFMGPAWNEFVASTVPRTLRGRLFALRQAISGIIGIGAGFAVTHILETAPFPQNFSYLFLTTFLFWIASLTCLTFVHETAQPVRNHASLRQYLFQHVPQILQSDNDFRWFLAVKAGMLLSLISFGFYSVYAIKRFDLPASEAGAFVRYYMFGAIGWSFLFGYLADRFGHRINVILFCFIVIFQSAAALLAPSATLFKVIFLFLGANRSIQIITFVAMPMEYADSRDRPTYYALSNTLLAPFYLSALLGGFLIPFIGYRGLFVLAAGFAFLTSLGAVFFIRDPRHTRLDS
ncbi:MAG: MFS transporter [Candidatus Hinthialibacter sp.]